MHILIVDFRFLEMGVFTLKYVFVNTVNGDNCMLLFFIKVANIWTVVLQSGKGVYFGDLTKTIKSN